MEASKKESLPKAAPKKTKRWKSSSLRLHLSRLVNPAKWTLKGRFLYFTGILLLLGSVFQIIFLAYTLQKNVERNAWERLRILEAQYKDELSEQGQFLISQTMALAANPRIKENLDDQDRASLREYLLPYVQRLKRCTRISSLELHVMDNRGVVILHTDSLNVWGENLSTDPMFVEAKEELFPVSGLVMTPDGPMVRGLSPITEGDAFLGYVAATMSLAEALEAMVSPDDTGVSLILAKELEPTLDLDLEREVAGRWLLLASLGRMDGSLARQALLQDLRVTTMDKAFFAFMPLEDYARDPMGGLLMTYDSTAVVDAKWNRIYQLGGLFFSGALLLWLFLNLNVSRIESFFSRLKKIIIASHSNDFGERFESDHIHCLDVMHCHNEECPVYQDPTRVCYLETGSEAISPRWRDTCIFLNKYETCGNCPVYAMRKGDELAEMRNVVNTMMRLWGNFLSRTGHLLAYVLRSQETTGQLPSLDDVSDRLESMAKLTFFSHDLQGTLDKDEVYQQLAYVFTENFHISRFVLFEVDKDSDRIVIALDKTNNEFLCKKNVLLAGEICRANRVAEDVFSFYNPKLCPYFNCDLDKDVRCCLPMVMGGKVGAVFSFLAPKAQWERIRGVIPVLRKYLDEAAPVLSSLRLLKLSKEQALRDPLTHCHNRRFLDEFISKYEPLSERDNKKTGFLMADVDYFKQVNDDFGHEAGDAVLQQVVALINGSIRRSDLLIRYGGEEFLILLQDVKNGMAEKVAEKIRLAVDQHKFDLPGGAQIHKTISLGVSEFPEDANTLYKAIKYADVALYEAKNGGRNLVVRFQPHMWTGDQY